MKAQENTGPNIPAAEHPSHNGPAADPEPSTFNPQPSTDQPAQGPSRQRNGAIARLPKATRRRINEMLDDGVEYQDIINSLGEEGKGINTNMVYRWKGGGYQDYLREQRLLEQCRIRQQTALELLAKNSAVNGFQATQQLASAQICEVLAEMGSETFREALTASPHNLFRMLNTFARLTNGGLKCERHLADEAERQQRLAEERTPNKKGISKKAVAQMNEKLNLM